MSSGVERESIGLWIRWALPRPGRSALILALGLSAASCAHGVGRDHASATAPAVDSATVVLWRMDEPGGFNVGDSGPHHLTARAGGDVGTDFGRFRGARVFTHSIESFLYVPYAALLETGPEISVEAWIQPTALVTSELAPIVGRWSEQANEQSWMFGIVGPNLGEPGLTSPGFLSEFVPLGQPAHLMFGFQPADASVPVSYFSSAEIEFGRWTHVAVAYDGHEVLFYIDGRLDSQYAFEGRIRPSQAPLLFANYFDTRWITDLGDRPQVGSGVDRIPHYAYQGMIDELRISDVARSVFLAGRRTR